MAEIEAGVRQDHPDWPEDKVQQHTQLTAAALREEDRRLYNNERRFRRHNQLTPDPDIEAWGLSEDDDQNDAA